MKPQRRRPEDIEGLPDQPIHIRRFDPAYKQAALLYQERLNQILIPWNAQAELTGSVALEIATKGEWEYAIYLDDAGWYPVLVGLINHFHAVHYLSEDLAVFTDVFEGIEIEVFPVRNEAAARNRAIMTYWQTNPGALQAYEQGKLDHTYSKREYYRWKDNYFAEIVETL
jgi:hypothetical protein